MIIQQAMFGEIFSAIVDNPAFIPVSEEIVSKLTNRKKNVIPTSYERSE